MRISLELESLTTNWALPVPRGGVEGPATNPPEAFSCGALSMLLKDQPSKLVGVTVISLAIAEEVESTTSDTALARNHILPDCMDEPPGLFEQACRSWLTASRAKQLTCQCGKQGNQAFFSTVRERSVFAFYNSMPGAVDGTRPIIVSCAVVSHLCPVQ
jgi:hypothetical protein